MARCLVASGAKVVLIGRRNEELQKACAVLGPSAFALVGDVTKLATASGVLDQAEKLAGPVSILINNAGVHLKKPAAETSDAEFATVIQTHVFGAFALTRETGRRMIERKSGCILFTASMASFMGIPLVVAYSAAKSAYVGIVRSLATEWGQHGVRVNAIAPGWIASPMLDQALSGDPARKAKILSRTPMNKFGDPDDIGWAAVYLCSPASKFVTGVVLPVDGGAAIGF
jgi:gluconate 5-dehydrogenase